MEKIPKHEVYLVNLISNSRLGFLLLESVNNKWGFSGDNLKIGETIESALYRSAQSDTGIDDIRLKKILLLKSYPEGEVGPAAKFGVFVLSDTEQSIIQLDSNRFKRYKWFKDKTEISNIELFHPDVEKVVGLAGF